jgi:indolepyruvate ferredoxin oxidoreductase alpha subunit
VRRVVKVDPFEPEECIKVLREETAAEEVSVIITTRPCVFAEKEAVLPPLEVIGESCGGCKVCVSLNCPAISWDIKAKRAAIDAALCTGCLLCRKVCEFGAIGVIEGDDMIGGKI